MLTGAGEITKIAARVHKIFAFFTTDCPFYCINILADTNIGFFRIWEKVKNKH